MKTPDPELEALIGVVMAALRGEPPTFSKHLLAAARRLRDIADGRGYYLPLIEEFDAALAGSAQRDQTVRYAPAPDRGPIEVPGT